MDILDDFNTEGAQNTAVDPVKRLHACIDMISCYASTMSILCLGPEFVSTLDLIQMMEELKGLLVDECFELQRILDERIRPGINCRE